MSLTKKSVDDAELLFKKIQTRLQNELNTPDNSIMLEYIDVKSWIDSKVNKVSFEEAVKTNIQ